MNIVVFILAIIGLACLAKYIARQEGCILCGWQKTKEDVQKAAEKASFKIKVEDEKRTGTRYGSNPIKY
jgi:hypothetical protein